MKNLNQSKYLIIGSLSHLCDKVSKAVILFRGLLANNLSKKLYPNSDIFDGL